MGSKTAKRRPAIKKNDIVLAETHVRICDMPFLTTRLAMIYLDCSRDKIDDLRKSAKIPHFYKLGKNYYYDRRDLDKLILSAREI